MCSSVDSVPQSLCSHLSTHWPSTTRCFQATLTRASDPTWSTIVQKSHLEIFIGLSWISRFIIFSGSATCSTETGSGRLSSSNSFSPLCFYFHNFHTALICWACVSGLLSSNKVEDPLQYRNLDIPPIPPPPNSQHPTPQNENTLDLLTVKNRVLLLLYVIDLSVTCCSWLASRRRSKGKS